MENWPVINMHAHVYPDELAERAVRSLAELYPIPVQCDGTLDGLREDGRKAGISRFVLCSPAIKPENVQGINSFIAQCCRESPDCIGFGTLHPWTQHLDFELDYLKHLGLKGVKLHPDGQRFRLDSPAAERMFALIEKSGLPVLLHMGAAGADTGLSDPASVRALALRHPEMMIIAAHMGGLFAWEDAPEQLTGLPNVCFDMSSVMPMVTEEQFLHAVRTVGTDRIFFGTDYPLWKSDDAMRRFRALPLTEPEQRDILYRNFRHLILKEDV